MGITERRAREKEQRRQAIIEAAEQVFFAKGLGAATMENIAEAAELSKGTLYLYFERKEDLYLALIVRAMAMLLERFRAAVAARERGIDKVEAIGQAYFEFYKAHPDHFNAMLYYESHTGDERESSEARACDELGNEAMALCAQAVRVGIDDGSIRADVDPVKIALTLWGLSTGLLQFISIKGARCEELYEIDPHHLIDSFFDLVHASLRRGDEGGKR